MSFPVGPLAKPVDNAAGGALNYNAFNYALEDLTPLLPAPNSPIVIAAATIAQALRGRSKIAPKSSYAFFDFRSLRYACVDADQFQVPITHTCPVQVSGVKYNTGAAVIQELIFNNVTGVSQLGSASFSEFTRVKQIYLQLIQATSGQVLGIPLPDNLLYKAYPKC